MSGRLLALPRRTALQEIETNLAQSEVGAADRALLHRDAVYLALDLGEAARAMTHALSALELARACQDGPLQVKAHVALALVQAESYDDLGAGVQFALADQLARRHHDDRGVALIAVNTSHYELERRNYGEAVLLLTRLLRSEHVRGLALPESLGLLTTFHINFVVGAAEALLGGQIPLAEQPEAAGQLRLSAASLRGLEREGGDTPSLEATAVLDALTRYALWQGDLTAARQLADEHVRLTGQADVPLLHGRALLDRSRVRGQTGDLEAAIGDAQQAVGHFRAAANGLWESRARETLAEVYARAGRFEQAFEAQRAVTRGMERLFRDYHQQRALVGQIAQQAREAEVHAQAMAQAALSDPLTGIPNRTQAMQVLARLREQAVGGGPVSAIALMDLDHFKRVNDLYGHLTGDAVLIEVTRLLTAELRSDDVLARLGGEEFVVILAGAALSEAVRLCEHLRDILHRADWEHTAPGLNMTASFGIAVLSGELDLTATLQAADRALYAAKAAGRNAVQVDPQLQVV
ncbi:GGDEF domain-containing protein [Deinococcus rubellus]|uniref:GGDEF domain-containing protein n=1 Tax=Deinococcus rubellus TaxID=1889240 RepID=A0ABY5YHE7_9DEIO|nr:GGDEF domain-containing protein [Deinococcus rubellus]UWX63591.1 GGDEF domain-containing protein [Deinococcus rubellus]